MTKVISLGQEPPWDDSTYQFWGWVVGVLTQFQGRTITQSVKTVWDNFSANLSIKGDKLLSQCLLNRMSERWLDMDLHLLFTPNNLLKTSLRTFNVSQSQSLLERKSILLAKPLMLIVSVIQESTFICIRSVTLSQIYPHWNWNSNLNAKLKLEFWVKGTQTRKNCNSCQWWKSVK